MALHTGIEGVVREIRQLFTGIEGVVREIIEEYTGKDGVVCPIFSAKKKYYIFSVEKGVAITPVKGYHCNDDGGGGVGGITSNNFETNNKYGMRPGEYVTVTYTSDGNAYGLIWQVDITDYNELWAWRMDDGVSETARIIVMDSIPSSSDRYEFTALASGKIYNDAGAKVDVSSLTGTKYVMLWSGSNYTGDAYSIKATEIYLSE